MTAPDPVQLLRREALKIFAAGCAAADPEAQVKAALARHAGLVSSADRVLLIAFGKAAPIMAGAAIDALGPKISDALVLTHHDNVRTVPGAIVMGGGHPVPDQAGEAAARRIADRVRTARAGDLVLALVSGGGSALLVAPAEGLTLDDKIEANRQLIASGMPITGINAVRSALSGLKGGGLAALAGPATMLSLILSDVPGDDPAVIASGPTVPAHQAGPDPVLMIRQFGLDRTLPAHLLPVIARAGRKPPPQGQSIAEIVGSNALSVAAAADAARARGYDTTILPGWIEGDVADLAERLAGMARKLSTRNGPQALIAGGEATVRIVGRGLGGRNQELALRIALIDHDMPLCRPFACLSGGTDGRDGPTDAAGGLIDPGTIGRIIAAGGAPEALLADNDSHRALTLSNDLVITGPTGTNVADLMILLMR